MITFQEALAIVEHTITPVEGTETIPLEMGLNRVLGRDVSSPIDMPPFRQSAMDGYAVCMADGSTYNLVGEVRAGDGHDPELQPGEAVRIFTGAPVPETANAIVIQEHTTVEDNAIKVQSDVVAGANIRPMGEQVKRNATALKGGTRLHPAAVGFLASLGITHITVYTKPRVAVLVTGNELAPPGAKLNYG